MFYLGLDLGQRHDPSALVAIERIELYRAWQSSGLHSLRLRFLQRVHLGTPYPLVVDRVRQIVTANPLVDNCALVVDATGVGAPVVDMLKAARLGCEITPVNITGGDRQHKVGATWNLPKQDPLASLQVTLDRGELKIAHDLPDLGPLLRELIDFRSVIHGDGRIRLGADGCGEHDDLVIALALAVWRAQRPVNTSGTQRIV